MITILTGDSSGVDVKAGELTQEYIGRMFERIGTINWISTKTSLGVVDTISLHFSERCRPSHLGLWHCDRANTAIPLA